MSRIGLNSLTRATILLDPRQSASPFHRLYHISYKINATLPLAEQVCFPSGRGTLVLCQGSPADSQFSQDAGIQVDIAVSGMMCDGCTSRIEEELGKKDSVVSAQADLDSGMVSVIVSVENFGDAAKYMESLVHDINEMGFEAKPIL